MRCPRNRVNFTKHSRTQSRQQRLGEFAFAGSVRPQVGTQDDVRGALDQHRATSLRVAGVAGHAGSAAGVAESLRVVGFVGKLERGAVDGHQPQAGIERLRVVLRVGQGNTAARNQVAQRCRADPTAQPTDGGLAYRRRLGRSAGPGQALGDNGKHLFVRRLGIQTQGHAVVHPGHRGETAYALTVAAVLVEHGMHRVGRHHPGQQAGRQEVTQPGSSAQCRLGSCHTPARVEFCHGGDCSWFYI